MTDSTTHANQSLTSEKDLCRTFTSHNSNQIIASRYRSLPLESSCLLCKHSCVSVRAAPAPHGAFAGGATCSELAPTEAKLPCRANAAPSRASCWAGCCTLQVSRKGDRQQATRLKLIIKRSDFALISQGKGSHNFCFSAENVVSFKNNNTAGCLQLLHCTSPMQKQALKHWDKEGVRQCVLRVTVCRLSQIFHYQVPKKALCWLLSACWI